MSGVLYVVGTPIGNLADLTDRARDTLRAVDVVAAEDTRRTGRLLKAAGINATLVSLFDGNERERTPQLVRKLLDGSSVALVSDGGMPLVSDPGYRLVSASAAGGIDVQVVPGPSAVLAALVVSGLPMDRFAFEGFPPRKVGERRARLAALANDPRTLVFFESPVRTPTLLRDLQASFGDRRVAVCRELTKLHEQVVRGRLHEVIDQLGEGPLRGEVVVVVEGSSQPPPIDQAAIVAQARELVAGGMRKREAAREVADRHGASANELYRALVDGS
jgi:16S rRNA (cytidine1402-2'-O)-methyltransferase